MDNYMVQYG